MEPDLVVYYEGVNQFDRGIPKVLPARLGGSPVVRRMKTAGDSIRGVMPYSAAPTGTDFALASFVWLVSDGLRLDPFRHGFIFTTLNERFWPLRYADLRRLVDFENRVFERYVSAHGAVFVDLARAYPQDPDLFLDFVHMNEAGTRVQAWIVMQALLPHIRRRLESGAWPRPDREPLAAHPNLGPPRLWTVTCAPGTAPDRPRKH